MVIKKNWKQPKFPLVDTFYTASDGILHSYLKEVVKSVYINMGKNPKIYIMP